MRSFALFFLAAASVSPASAGGTSLKQVTNQPYGHILTNTNVWSPDSQWICYDIRSDEGGAVFDGTRIERVRVDTGEVRVLYTSQNQACCGVVTYNPVSEEVVFIHGPENPSPDWSYAAYHRRGVLARTDSPGTCSNLDARDLTPPFTPGALRGGTHVHVFSGDGAWVSFTYEDHVLSQFEKAGRDNDINLRNVGVSAPFGPVRPSQDHPRNHDGARFSCLVTRTVAEPAPGSDEICKAFSDAWVGTHGYVKKDGSRQRRAIAFQGHVLLEDGRKISEVFIVDLPDDVTLAGKEPLEGTARRAPAPPQGTRQRRLTHTGQRKHPGLQGPRHWLRSSPDGSRIAFLMKDDQGVIQLWTVSPTGGAPRQVTRNPWDVASAFSWGPHGQRIAYVCDHSVFVTEEASGLSLRLTPRWDDSTSPRPEACVFSPDGKRIAFVRRVPHETGEVFNQIFVVDCPDLARVPGTVIDHIPASTKCYVGSPSIAILPDGSYVASHDIFGQGSTFDTTRVFASNDRGATWRMISVVKGQFWSTLFVHRDALYLIGTNERYGDAVIRRSRDGGHTWTEPKDKSSGLLRDDHRYHCAPMPVIEHRGRLWRAMEDAGGPGGWGSHFRSIMMSVPEDADLLQAENWTFSEPLGSDLSWLEGKFNGWLEGNAVVTPNGNLVNILRVDEPSGGGRAALVHVSEDGTHCSFQPDRDFLHLPGANTKFTIRYDAKSGLYWTLANAIPDIHKGGDPGATRNTLALLCSPDLEAFHLRCLLLYHEEVGHHGFQYVDWVVEGDDLIVASRTAHDDGLGGAHNFHDANFLTFHRVGNFRQLTPKDSIDIPEPKPVVAETDAFTVKGFRFTVATLQEDQKAYDNREYLFQNVPQDFLGWRFTRTSGGIPPRIQVKANRDCILYIATGVKNANVDLDGWSKTEHTFLYTDAGRNGMAIYQRPVQAGEEIEIPQGNWTGTLVLLPPI